MNADEGSILDLQVTRSAARLQELLPPLRRNVNDAALESVYCRNLSKAADGNEGNCKHAHIVASDWTNRIRKKVTSEQEMVKQLTAERDQLNKQINWLDDVHKKLLNDVKTF